MSEKTPQTPEESPAGRSATPDASRSGRACCGGDAAAAPASAEPQDDTVTSTGRIHLEHGSLDYQVTTGRVVLRHERLRDGTFHGHRAEAEVFITSYVAQGADPATRPVTFAFNGGPGSASMWLHLGLLGPRRVECGDAETPAAPPYRLVDNPDTLLAHTDLVLIDPVSTGYSRSVEGGKPADFHGYAADVDSVTELIRLWTTREDRWLSPKFIAGESYGTIRGTAVCEKLQRDHGMYLNGLVLISSVLDMGTVMFTAGNDLPYVTYLPTYAALAHYHGKHRGRSLAEVVAEAERFAAGDYRLALDAGNRLSPERFTEIARRTAELCGLDEDYVRRSRLRVGHKRFFAELLRDQGSRIGRIDGRFRGPALDGTAEEISSDPSIEALKGPFASAINHYLRHELGYHNDLPYQVLSQVQPWSYAEFEGAHVSVVSSLAAAMSENRHLKVHLACGYFDGATPHYAAEHAISGLPIPDELLGNIEFAYYEAGHMTYIPDDARARQSADIADFLHRSTG